MFAAQAGAKKVYAVDASNVLERARKVFERNGFSDTIQTFKGLIEEIELPSKVDIIISEWMGYLLFFENMLPSVLYARDKYLVEGGKLFPDKCDLLMFGFAEQDKHEEFWRNCYGLDLIDIYEVPHNDDFVHCISVDASTICTNTVSIKKCVIDTTVDEDMEFNWSGYLTCERDGLLDAFGFYFTTTFPGGIVLSTAPELPDTHWFQSVVYLPQPLTVKAGEKVHIELSHARSPQNKRNVDIYIEVNHGGRRMTQLFKLN